MAAAPRIASQGDRRLPAELARVGEGVPLGRRTGSLSSLVSSRILNRGYLKRPACRVLAPRPSCKVSAEGWRRRLHTWRACHSLQSHLFSRSAQGPSLLDPTSSGGRTAPAPSPHRDAQCHARDARRSRTPAGSSPAHPPHAREAGSTPGRQGRRRPLVEPAQRSLQLPTRRGHRGGVPGLGLGTRRARPRAVREDHERLPARGAGRSLLPGAARRPHQDRRRSRRRQGGAPRRRVPHPLLWRPRRHRLRLAPRRSRR